MYIWNYEIKTLNLRICLSVSTKPSPWPCKGLSLIGSQWRSLIVLLPPWPRCWPPAVLIQSPVADETIIPDRRFSKLVLHLPFEFSVGLKTEVYGNDVENKEADRDQDNEVGVSVLRKHGAADHGLHVPSIALLIIMVLAVVTIFIGILSFTSRMPLVHDCVGVVRLAVGVGLPVEAEAYRYLHDTGEKCYHVEQD